MPVEKDPSSLDKDIESLLEQFLKSGGSIEALFDLYLQKAWSEPKAKKQIEALLDLYLEKYGSWRESKAWNLLADQWVNACYQVGPPIVLKPGASLDDYFKAYLKERMAPISEQRPRLEPLLDRYGRVKGFEVESPIELLARRLDVWPCPLNPYPITECIS